MARQRRASTADTKGGVSFRRVCVCVAILLGPFFQSDAYAQGPENWRVTLLQLASAGEQIPGCAANASVTVVVPGPTGVAPAVDICGVQATFTVAAQSVTLALSGAFTIEGFGLRCVWDITTPIRGSGFISGGSVPATSMTGTAHTTCGGFGDFTNSVSGSFQAQRVVVGGGVGIVNFTGAVEVTLPGAAPIALTPATAAGLVLPVGTQVRVRAASSLTLAFPNGNVALGANTNLTVSATRFFLLVPWRVPLQQSFERITWRCIPTPGGCASMATPNARLAFLPPIAAPPGIAVLADEEDLTLSVTYSEAGGLGTSVVSVEAGRVEVRNLLGESTLVSAGQEARVISLAAGVAPLNVNGDAVPDVLRYDPATGVWVVEPGGGLPASTGTWLPGRDVAPGDFDGNGLTDFLLHDSTTGAARVALNDAQGGFTEVDSSWAPGWRASVLNLNGDRWSDVFLHQPATGQWIQAIGQGGGGFLNVAGQWASGWEPHPLDLDGDDTVDLLLFNAASGGWLWAVSDGAGAFAHPASGEWEGVTNVYPGDFTADGRWDALLYDSRTGAWSLATNTGSGFSYQTGTVAAGAEFVVADLDGDGDDDALLYDSGSGQMSVHLAETLADGTARLVAATSTVWAPNWRVSPTHFNTDGRADLLLYFAEGGRWVKAYYSGSETFPHLDEGSWPTGLSVLSGQSLTQGLLPNDAAQTACAAEYDLRPTDSTATTTRSIEFVNASSGARRIYWLSPLGRRVLRGTLAANQRTVLQSTGAHSWVVTDTVGTCQSVYVAGDVPTRAVLP